MLKYNQSHQLYISVKAFILNKGLSGKAVNESAYYCSEVSIRIADGWQQIGRFNFFEIRTCVNIKSGYICNPKRSGSSAG